MNDVERAKHDAAVKLQQFVNARVRRAGGYLALHDAEAMAVVDAISVYVIKSLKEFLQQPMERTGSGD